MVCSLCLCDKEYFLSQWNNILLEHLVKNLHKTKAVGVDLIRLLLEVHMVKYPEIPIDEKLMVTTGSIFGGKDKKHTPILPQADYADALVDFICTISRFKLDYIMKHVMTSELLRPDIISPE